MSSPRKSQEEWIEAAIQALADGGAEAVRVEPLARALGVTKGSFYWHFTDRNALLDAVLDTWERAGTDAIIEEVERSGGDVRTRALHLWDRTSGPPGLRAELAIRDWARRDPAVAERVRRVDDRRMNYLRTLFATLGAVPHDVESRALLLYSLLIGNDFIVAGHGDQTRAMVLREAVAFILDAHRISIVT